MVPVKCGLESAPLAGAPRGRGVEPAHQLEGLCCPKTGAGDTGESKGTWDARCPARTFGERPLRRNAPSRSRCRPSASKFQPHFMSSPLQDPTGRLSPTLEEMLAARQARREKEDRLVSQPAHQPTHSQAVPPPPQLPQLSPAEIEQLHDEKMKSADLLTKLMMVTSSVAAYRNDELGIPGIRSEGTVTGKEVAASFTGLLARILQNQDSPDDAQAFRDMIKACHAMLEDVLADAVSSVECTQLADFRLTIAMVDLLRTAMQFEEHGFSGSSSREYSRESRSTQSISQGYGRIIPNAPDFAAQTYATGQQMCDNMDKGNDVLRHLSSLDDGQICDIINKGRKSLCNFVCASLFALLFDNRRLKAAFFIQVRFFGDLAPDFDLNKDTKTIFGDVRRLDAIFDQVGSISSLYRCLSSICALFVMARQGSFEAFLRGHVDNGKSVREAVELATQQAHETPHNVAACQLLGDQIGPTVYTSYYGGQNKARPDAPGANTKLLDIIADWFENTVQNRAQNEVFFEAFKAEIFSPNIMTDDVKQIWLEFNEMNDVDSRQQSFSLWQAADFIVTCRLQLHSHANCGTNIFVAALTVLSGAISNFMDPKLGGLFKFEDSIHDKVKQVVTSVLKKDPKLCLKVAIKSKGTIKDANGEEKRDSMGRACSNTKVTNMVFKIGAVRNQNGKSAMVDSRLTVALWMLSFTEDMKKDARENVTGLATASLACSATATQGRIGVRRIQILSFEMAPFANKVELRRTLDSHLIEKKRRRGQFEVDDSTEATRTTGDNTEKPMRDFVGGAVFNTLLYPLAGRAFIDCIPSIINKYGDGDLPSSVTFKANSAACYNTFLDALEHRAKSTLDWETVIPQHRDGLMLVDDFTDDFVKVLKQQFSFAMRVSSVTRNCGILWEALQNSFAIVRNEEDPERDGEDSIYAKHKVPDRSHPYRRRRVHTPTTALVPEGPTSTNAQNGLLRAMGDDTHQGPHGFADQLADQSAYTFEEWGDCEYADDDND